MERNFKKEIQEAASNPIDMAEMMAQLVQVRGTGMELLEASIVQGSRSSLHMPIKALKSTCRAAHVSTVASFTEALDEKSGEKAGLSFASNFWIRIRESRNTPGQYHHRSIPLRGRL